MEEYIYYVAGDHNLCFRSNIPQDEFEDIYDRGDYIKIAVPRQGYTFTALDVDDPDVIPDFVY